ncbi:MAG: hypothetical protein QXX36_01155 [Candidatus Rehaiarchaeum fermentans]|nr:hypothetical protein [Candidatus Rehaiarchaeum fermentans]MCW1302221.1 hypothetical protein [Candidatus Rehaiarchaeum fermentans]MCW1311561.1 hypothetical protein [Candidatus Rehaiarchaeum fermentans]
MNYLLLFPLALIEVAMIFEKDSIYSILLFALFSIISALIMFFNGYALYGYFILIVFTTGVVVLLIVSSSLISERLVNFDRKYVFISIFFILPLIMLSFSDENINPYLLVFPLLASLGTLIALYREWK